MATAKDKTAEIVDLGLSVKWATGNIVKNGAKYSIGAPTDNGYYFSWANVEGHYKGKGYDFSDNTYKSTPGYKLHTNISPTSGYDAARATLGGNWRLPTKDEFQELIDNCTLTWTTKDGVNGMRLTSKKSGYTSNSIFIPAAGMYDGTTLHLDGIRGRYWSSTFSSSNDAWGLYLGSAESSIYYYSRHFGFTVRAVQS